MKNRKIYTITQINQLAKKLLEDSFSEVWIEGEISNFKLHSSGHMYFSLKDETAQISAIIYRGMSFALKFVPEDGMKVRVKGKLTCFTKRGQYQIIISLMEPQGKGALQLAFEQLKERLNKEGLFDAEKKQKILFLPQKIGVVTSPTGAAIRDILAVIERRFANVEILIYPVCVQGDNAAGEIAGAIDNLNGNFSYLDVLIVGRGGGSYEDLWAFNEEIVARAIYRSKIPVISAVGHEIDYTIADFVADLRAPTPSAAAELVVRNKEELLYRLKNYQMQLTRNIQYKLNYLVESFSRLNQSSVFLNPFNFIDRKQQEIDYLDEGLNNNFKYLFNNKEKSFVSLLEKLNILNPLAVLARGYSISWKLPQNTILKNTEEVKINDKIKIRLFQGEMICEVIRKIEKHI